MTHLPQCHYVSCYLYLLCFAFQPPTATKDQNANLSPVQLLPKKEASDGEEEDDAEEDISVTVDQVAFNPIDDEFGYDGLLDEELDEEALLAADIDDDDESGLSEPRSWRH